MVTPSSQLTRSSSRTVESLLRERGRQPKNWLSGISAAVLGRTWGLRGIRQWLWTSVLFGYHFDVTVAVRDLAGYSSFWPSSISPVSSRCPLLLCRDSRNLEDGHHGTHSRVGSSAVTVQMSFSRRVSRRSPGALLLQFLSAAPRGVSESGQMHGGSGATLVLT